MLLRGFRWKSFPSRVVTDFSFFFRFRPWDTHTHCLRALSCGLEYFLRFRSLRLISTAPRIASPRRKNWASCPSERILCECLLFLPRTIVFSQAVSSGNVLGPIGPCSAQSVSNTVGAATFCAVCCFCSRVTRCCPDGRHHNQAHTRA